MNKYQRDAWKRALLCLTVDRLVFRMEGIKDSAHRVDSVLRDLERFNGLKLIKRDGDWEVSESDSGLFDDSYGIKP